MKTMEIPEIDEMFLKLSEDCVKEVKDFADYLFEREKKRKTFAERVSQAKQEPSVEFKSVDDLMKAIRGFKEYFVQTPRQKAISPGLIQTSQ